MVHHARVSVIFLVLIAWQIGALADPSQEVFCGLGPSPGSDSFLSRLERQSLQRRELGFVRVCDQDLDRADFSRFSKPVAEARKKLGFQPIDLSGPPFSQLEVIGELPEHRGDNGALALRRYFRTADGDIVAFFEWEMARAGGAVQHHGKLEHALVLDRVATVFRLRSQSNERFTMLTWESNGLYLEASVRSKNPRGKDEELLKSLAEAVETAQRQRPR